MVLIAFKCLLLVTCAWQNVDAKAVAKHGLGIYSGDAVDISKVPYFAQYIVQGADRGCGAVIVTNQFLLSRAYCYWCNKNESFFVKVGTDTIKGGINYNITKTIPHPKYVYLDVNNLEYDILVLKLTNELIFNERVMPIKLAEPNLVIKDGERMKTMGLGVHEEYGVNEETDHLMILDVPYVEPKKCENWFLPYGITATDKMACAGGENGKGVCDGDNSSPLIYKDQLIGLAFFVVTPCGSQGWPSLYTRISSYRTFIDNAINNLDI